MILTRASTLALSYFFKTVVLHCDAFVLWLLYGTTLCYSWLMYINFTIFHIIVYKFTVLIVILFTDHKKSSRPLSASKRTAGNSSMDTDNEASAVMAALRAENEQAARNKQVTLKKIFIICYYWQNRKKQLGDLKVLFSHYLDFIGLLVIKR